MLPEQRALPRALKTTALAALCAASAITVTACGTGESSSDGTAAAGTSSGKAVTTITTAWPADVTSLDPANLSTREDQVTSRNIYQTLALPSLVEQKDGTLKFDGAKVQPYLAESWELGDTSITFKLRGDVKFPESGNPLTATDVKYSFERVFDTPGAGDLQSNGLQSADDVHIVDPHTIKVDFKDADGKPTPVTPVLQVMFASHFMAIVDSKVVKQHATSSDKYAAKWLRTNTAGSGPYELADRTPGESLSFKAVEGSWTPAPSFGEVNVRVTSGSIASLVQNKEINLAETGMTNQQVDNLAKGGSTVYWQNTGNFDMFAITGAPTDQVGPLGDKRVRQAIGYALPYDDILKNVVYGRGKRSGSIVSPTAPEFAPAWSKYTTDLAKAKALMAEAGNPAISVPLHYLQGNEDQTNKAILIQANLEKIGIKSKMTPETQGGLFDVVNARSAPEKGAKIGPPGLELFNWSAFTDDPRIVIGYWATKGGINNYALFSDDEVNATHKTFGSEPGSPERTAAYTKAQEIIADDASYLPIVDTGAITVVDGGISGVSFSPGGSGRFWTLHPSGTESEINAALFE